MIDDYIAYRERDHRHGGTSAGMLRQIIRVSNFWWEYAGEPAVEAIDTAEGTVWLANYLETIGTLVVEQHFAEANALGVKQVLESQGA